MRIARAGGASRGGRRPEKRIFRIGAAMRAYHSERTPKYLQIYEWANAMIRKGRWRIGDKIPTEPALARQFEASRMTVRKAIDPLVLKGILERRRGRGTFVVSTGGMKLTYDAGKPIRFFHDMENIGMPHRFEVTNTEVLEADRRIRSYLNLGHDPKVIRLDIILYAEDKPVIIEQNYFPHAEFRKLLSLDLTIPPLQLAAEELNVQVSQVRQYISATVAGEREREIFQVDYPIPCLYLEWISCDEDGLPFSVSLCHYRGDTFKFKIPTSELVRPDTV